MDRRGLVLCLVSAAAFGSMAILARGAYAAGVSIPTLLVGRFLVAAAVLWLLVALRRAAVTKRKAQGKALAVGAVVYATQAALFFIAVSRLDATLAALLLYVYPFLVFLVGVARGHEHASRERVVPLLMAGVGVSAVLVGGSGTGAVDPIGVAAALGAAVVYTVYFLAAGNVVATTAPLAASALMMTGAAGATAVAAAGMGDLTTHFAASGWIWIGALALGSTVVGVWTLAAGLKRIGATNASIISTTEPIITVGLAMLLLGEHLAPAQLVGAASVLTALVMLQRAQPVSVSGDDAAPLAADRTAARALAHEPA